jgi:hypothetical protein
MFLLFTVTYVFPQNHSVVFAGSKLILVSPGFYSFAIVRHFKVEIAISNQLLAIDSPDNMPGIIDQRNLNAASFSQTCYQHPSASNQDCGWLASCKTSSVESGATISPYVNIGYQGKDELASENHPIQWYWQTDGIIAYIHANVGLLGYIQRDIGRKWMS